jgi:magnesium chelatase family protein
MSVAVVYSRARLGIEAPLVTVEVHLSNGLPSMSIVGMPETGVRESKDRVRSAILNSHLEFPSRRITINLAPADLPKEGGRYDLAIALGILAASKQVPEDSLRNIECVGELALSGALRRVNAVLPAALACGRAGRKFLVPTGNAHEASLCDATPSYSAGCLLKVCAHLHGREYLPLCTPEEEEEATSTPPLDLSDVKGQRQAKRALTIAAAGSHNLLLFGPPGTGKTLLAQRLPSLLPPLTNKEALEVAAIHSLGDVANRKPRHTPPLRSPHHTATPVAMLGGGILARPGEVSLAHRGVLFLDELPEFQRRVLEVMREPLESGRAVISRANNKTQYPAQFQLVAAMNPCPCGYHGDAGKNCRCTPEQIKRYQDKISGPLLDRIDLQVMLSPLKKGELFGKSECSKTEFSRESVSKARDRQLERQAKPNNQLSSEELQTYCHLCKAGIELLGTAEDKLRLSARAQHRIIKVARTIADLEVCKDIKGVHLSEALSLRLFAT